MRKMWFLAMVVVLAAGLAAAAAEPAAIGLNIMALPGTTGLSLVKLFEEPPDLGPGVTAGYSVVKSPDQMIARIISGEADIAAIPTNTAAILYNKGVGLRLAAITNWGVTYVVGQDDSIKTWRDLEDREIAVSGRGATPDILCRYFLQANGIDPEAGISLRYYPSPAELTQLLAAGRIPLAVLPEPWVTEAIARNPSLKILLDFQAEWKRLEKRDESYPQSCLVVKAELAKAQPRVVAEFLRAAAAASAWVNDHPEAAGRLAEKYVQISAAAARDAVPRCNLRFAEAAAVRDEIDRYLRRLLEIDPQAVGGKTPDAGFYF